MELLIQAHLTRESLVLPPALLKDYRHMLELAPRLLEELMKASSKYHASPCVLLYICWPFIEIGYNIQKII